MGKKMFSSLNPGMGRLLALGGLILLLAGCALGGSNATPIPTEMDHSGMDHTGMGEGGMSESEMATREAEMGQMSTEERATHEALMHPSEPTLTALVPTPMPSGEHDIALLTAKNDTFSASGICATCHMGLTDAAGKDVSLDSDWRSTMMANAARDPYWQAGVRREIEAYPEHQAAIEDECTSCHMPMAQSTAKFADGQGTLVGEGFANEQHELHALAMDGVSCNLCHQITEENLGTSASYSGYFVIDSSTPVGERLVYGPYNIPRGMARTMTAATGYVPTRGLHIQESSLCGSCHTLYTHNIGEDGELLPGEFPEQTPYIEWLHSDYPDRNSCQNCHMPAAEGQVKISNVSMHTWAPFSQHKMVGGNAYMLTVFQQNGAALEATASDEHFGKTIQHTLDLLQKGTATLALENASRVDGNLEIEVVITNLAGHKFPSAYPSRRSWLHLTVLDASGKVIFESGAANPDGSIMGNDNDDDPGAYEPHYLTVSQPDQVQIYETIMVKSLEKVTTTLLSAARYTKDNRLLPAGFDKESATPDIAVQGEAAADADFIQGGDRVRYQIALGSAAGPYTVQVELLYQTIGYRWMENLRGVEGPEVDFLFSLVDGVPNTPVVIGTTQIQVNP